jgi:hypothetical protein
MVDPDELERVLADHPPVRYATVKELWPEIEQHPWNRRWMQRVPLDIVIRALLKEMDVDRRVTDSLRSRAEHAERLVSELRDAALRVVAEVA